MFQWLGTLAAIVVVDLALSGDNALIIGAVASRLAGPQRRFAIVFGGVMAIVLRILLAEAALLVLQVRYIQAIGGAIVFIIAAQMVAEQLRDGGDRQTKASRRFAPRESLLLASLTIVVADISMSLDNVLAVAALANGNYLVLIFGILLSMILLLIASSLVAKLIERFPPLLYLAAGILAWTAGSMILNDKGLNPYVNQLDHRVPGPPLAWFVSPLMLALLVLVWVALRAAHTWRTRRRNKTGA
jgi:YjbE family integral membrane protein